METAEQQIQTIKQVDPRAEELKRTELSSTELLNLVEIVLRHQTDEELAPLAKSITSRLRDEGLNQAYDDLGISRFLGFTEKEREAIEEGARIRKKDGPFTLIYDLRPTRKARRELEHRRTEVPGDPIPVNAVGAAYSSRKHVAVNARPITLGEQLLSYLKGTPRVSQLRDSLALRIHEASHHYNSNKTGKARIIFTDANTVIGDIFREAHSCLVWQLCNLCYEDSEFVDNFTQDPQKILEVLSSRYGEEAAREYVDHYLTHKSSLLDPRVGDMARYAVDVIWRLRALGLNEREIGEVFAMFQRKMMLKWNKREKRCDKVEQWIQSQMVAQGLSKEDLAAKIAEKRQEIRENNRKVSKIIAEETIKYFVNLDYSDIRTQTEDSIIVGQSPLGVHFPRGVFLKIELRPGFQLGVKRIDLPNRQTEEYQPDNFSVAAWARSLLGDTESSKAEDKIESHFSRIRREIEITPIQKLVIEEAIKLLQEKQGEISDSYGQKKIGQLLGRLKSFSQAVRIGEGGERGRKARLSSLVASATRATVK